VYVEPQFGQAGVVSIVIE